MPLTQVRIQNFRCFKDFAVEPKPYLNAIVGGNNAGKTSLLEALDRALGRSSPTFAPEDFYSATSGAHISQFSPLTIDLEFAPETPLPALSPPSSASATRTESFSEAFKADLLEGIVVDPSTRSERLRFRTEAKYDATEDRIVTSFFFLDHNGAPKAMYPRLRQSLRSYFPFYRADAFRDVLSELRTKRSFWGRIIESVTVDPATTQEVQTAIDGLNLKVRGAAPRLNELDTRLREVDTVVRLASGGDAITLNPIPADVSEILRNLEVLVRLRDSPRAFPLSSHGEGTRSIAYLAIFRAFVGLVAKEENDNSEAAPILGIEEPEVHLHPHATRGLYGLLSERRYQTFITTHSPSVVQLVRAMQVTLFRRAAGDVLATQLSSASGGLGSIPVRLEEQIDRLLSTIATDVLFGRAVLLCEGPSEKWALPVFATSMGVGLDASGISVVGVGGAFYRPLLRALAKTSFSIPWVILSDSEPRTLRAVSNALQEFGYVADPDLNTARANGRLVQDVLLPNDCFCYDPGPDLEAELLRVAGASTFENAIGSCISPNAVTDFVNETAITDVSITKLPREDQVAMFIRAGPGRDYKPVLARTVAQLITNDGRDSSRVPAPVRGAIERARDFAEEAASKIW